MYLQGGGLGFVSSPLPWKWVELVLTENETIILSPDSNWLLPNISDSSKKGSTIGSQDSYHNFWLLRQEFCQFPVILNQGEQKYAFGKCSIVILSKLKQNFWVLYLLNWSFHAQLQTHLDLILIVSGSTCVSEII